MSELNSLFDIYLYTGDYKNGFYISLRQNALCGEIYLESI